MQDIPVFAMTAVSVGPPVIATVEAIVLPAVPRLLILPLRAARETRLSTPIPSSAIPVLWGFLYQAKSRLVPTFVRRCLPTIFKMCGSDPLKFM